ncbi:hypothetical protein A2U01_0055234, partial [Trifolium medium]|nr:hypothetical protein [Trifolium medium]
MKVKALQEKQGFAAAKCPRKCTKDSRNGKFAAETFAGTFSVGKDT